MCQAWEAEKTLWNRIDANERERLKAEKDEAQLQEHMAKNGEARLLAAGEKLALVTRRRLRGDATTSETLRLALCEWDEARAESIAGGS